MTNEEPRPDYSELLKSPYEDSSPDPKEQGGHGTDDGEISWKPAVFAAALGALLVGAFVIYAIVVSPDEPLGAAPTETVASTTTVPDPVPATDFPPGFTAVTESVGAHVEAVDVSSTATALAVSTAVRGGLDPAEVPPLDVAYWELALPSGPSLMTAQYPLRGALGSITVEFAPLASSSDLTLVPYLADGTDTDSDTIELSVAVPSTVEAFTIELDDERSVEVDSRVIGDGWGHVTWTSRGGPAKVDTVVRFVGTDDPSTEDIDETLLTSAHLQPLTQGSGVAPLAPLFGFAGSEQLIRSGEPLGADNQPDAIVVEIRVEMPSSVVEGPAIAVPSNG